MGGTHDEQVAAVDAGERGDADPLSDGHDRGVDAYSENRQKWGTLEKEDGSEEGREVDAQEDHATIVCQAANRSIDARSPTLDSRASSVGCTGQAGLSVGSRCRYGPKTRRMTRKIAPGSSGRVSNR